jgi:hypothetical protein
MTRSQQLRERAEECAFKATTAINPHAKAAFEHAQRQWLLLAEQVEQLERERGG